MQRIWLLLNNLDAHRIHITAAMVFSHPLIDAAHRAEFAACEVRSRAEAQKVPFSFGAHRSQWALFSLARDFIEGGRHDSVG